MRKWKKFTVIFAVSVLVVGLGLLSWYRWSLPSDEINRARLTELIDNDLVVSATISPTFYPGIYSVEGVSKSGAKPGKFTITTHLEEAQVKALLDLSEAKVDVPGKAGNKGQWVSIVSSLVIVG